MQSITQAFNHAKANTFVRISTSFLFLLLCANFRVLIPTLSPVAFTMHTFAIFILGSMLPFKESVACFAIYAIGRAFNAPFFGPACTLNSYVFGYFIGMVSALYFLYKTKKMAKIPLLAKLIVADLLILAVGAFNMSFSLGLKNAVYLGILPFLVSGILKVFAAYTFLKSKDKLLAK